MASGNQALDVNPPNADYHLSRAGSDWLWTVFSLFGVSLFAIVAWTFLVRVPFTVAPTVIDLLYPPDPARRAGLSSNRFDSHRCGLHLVLLYGI